MNLRTRQAAQYLGLSKSSLDKYRCNGGGPAFIRLGRAVVYATDDLDAWLGANRHVPGKPANDNSINEAEAA